MSKGLSSLILLDLYANPLLPRFHVEGLDIIASVSGSSCGTAAAPSRMGRAVDIT